MTKSELLTKILANRIKTMKVNGLTDFTEVTDTMDIFLVGGSITSEEYATLIELINE
jgi:coenzyme F420-reducing hydrogenase gamma subunit